MRNKSALERFLEAVEKTGNETLRWYYQHKMIKDQLFDKQTLDLLANEVANRLTGRVSIDVDTTDANQEIEKLIKIIARIGKKGV